MTVEAPSLKQPRTDSDSPWKHALDLYFRDFMEYCLPQIAQQIDWRKGYELLDKELQAIGRNTETGNRVVDKLIKVWEKNGRETWFLCHLEVQGSPEKEFPERMLIYRYRIRDRYQKSIVSIAILTDNRPNWHPDHYQESYYGSSLETRYLVIKLLDYRNKRQELEAMNSPFAIVILAQLAVLETDKNPKARLKAKTALTRQLYEKGWDKAKILQLYTLMDWLIPLREEFVIPYHAEIKHIEEEKRMNYITTAERIGRQEGFHEGLHEGEVTFLIRQLKHRFGDIPANYLQLIQQADNDTLLLWGERIFEAATLQEVFQ